MKIEGEGAIFTGRFVLLHHIMPERNHDGIAPPLPSHWDLLMEPPEKTGTEFPVESSEKLLTYRLMELPSPTTRPVGDQLPTGLSPPDAAASMILTRIADHRSHYLEYEGPISGDRGSVERVYSGQYRCETKEKIYFEFTGGHMQQPSEQLNASISLSAWGLLDSPVTCDIYWWMPS